MIEQILSTVDDYVLARSEGEDTLEYRKRFSELLMQFIDFRIKAELHHNSTDTRDKIINLLLNAPDPTSEDLLKLYTEWYKKRNNILGTG